MSRGGDVTRGGNGGWFGFVEGGDIGGGDVAGDEVGDKTAVILLLPYWGRCTDSLLNTVSGRSPLLIMPNPMMLAQQATSCTRTCQCACLAADLKDCVCDSDPSKVCSVIVYSLLTARHWSENCGRMCSPRCRYVCPWPL